MTKYLKKKQLLEERFTFLAHSLRVNSLSWQGHAGRQGRQRVTRHPQSGSDASAQPASSLLRTIALSMALLIFQVDLPSSAEPLWKPLRDTSGCFHGDCVSPVRLSITVCPCAPYSRKTQARRLTKAAQDTGSWTYRAHVALKQWTLHFPSLYHGSWKLRPSP